MNVVLQTEQMELTEFQQEMLAKLIEAGHDPDEARGWVLEYVDPDKPRFEVRDMSSANWVLRHLADCDAKEAAVNAMVDAEVEALHMRAERILGPIRNKREFFEQAYSAQLEEWARGQVEGQKSKSIKLLHGDIGFRKSPDKLVIDDEVKAIAWAESECPEAIKRSLLLNPAKKQLLQQCPNTKALADVMHIEEGGNTFYVKPAKPEVL